MTLKGTFFGKRGGKGRCAVVFKSSEGNFLNKGGKRKQNRTE